MRGAGYVALRVAPGKVNYSFVEATKLVFAGKDMRSTAEPKNLLNRLLPYTPFTQWVGQLRDGAVLRADLVAGLTVAMVLIPQSMAYAQLAGRGISKPVGQRHARVGRPRWGVHGRGAMSDLDWKEWVAC